MIFNKVPTLVSIGDFVDLYYKFKFRGIKFLFSKFSKFSFKSRVSSKWDLFTSQSDFWIIPEIKKNWNLKISDNKNIEYETYIFDKYLKGKENLNLLSIGCGAGIHERNFAKHCNFNRIVGIDLSKARIGIAKEMALVNNLEIEYYCDDFSNMKFSKGEFNVILFDSSLHHFNNIDVFLKNSVAPILNENGIVVIFEYCGPNRLSWRKSQLKESNRILNTLPIKYKTLIDGKSIKRKVYRPGLFRMILVDPSEAPDSENLVKSLNKNFDVLEEKKLGWNISHLLLKGISHNFLMNDGETKKLIETILDLEKNFVEITQENDAIFGVYKLKT